MVVINGRVLELQKRRNTKERKKQSVVFNFVVFYVLGADEVLTGQWCVGSIYGRLKVSDDGTTCHRGEGKAIINGCTDGSREISLQK